MPLRYCLTHWVPSTCRLRSRVTLFWVIPASKRACREWWKEAAEGFSSRRSTGCRRTDRPSATTCSMARLSPSRCAFSRCSSVRCRSLDAISSWCQKARTSSSMVAKMSACRACSLCCSSSRPAPAWRRPRKPRVFSQMPCQRPEGTGGASSVAPASTAVTLSVSCSPKKCSRVRTSSTTSVSRDAVWPCTSSKRARVSVSWLCRAAASRRSCSTSFSSAVSLTAAVLLIWLSMRWVSSTMAISLRGPACW
mmetsp:Transcript_10883/g.32604  ORF Transcript_10883/g.32604 Transcript_10883/m.32604 type:complete len:251 (+) Transcript_10883:1998-2750(+)